MKITNIEVFLTCADWRNFLFVKLTTDSGLIGWGDGTLEWKESTVRDLILDLGRRYVIGHNPFDIESLWFQIYQVEHNTGPIMYAAMAGIETAMWDLVGKALGQPVYNLVGGKVRSKIKAYANGWYA
jgi:galactonate dehydratase